MNGSIPRRSRSVSVGKLLARVRAIDPHLVDAVVALGLTAAALIVTAGRIGDRNQFREVDFLALVLVLLQTLPLAVRRVAPFGVFVLVDTALVTHAALGYEAVQPGTFGSAVATYGAASLTDSRRGILAAAITAPGLGIFFATSRQDYPAVDMLATSATWAMAWFLGTYVRIRGEQAEAAGERAESLERDQHKRAREAVADERARMARELHDIVGHALNVIVIQAAGAQRVVESRPEVARDSLASIETAGREALSDMERMLGVLRGSEASGRELGPQPSLSQVDSLAVQISEAGLPVEVTVEGKRPLLPASVELSAFRIVQEALTNSLKHSRGTRAKVTIRYRPTTLEIEVIDDGRGSPEQEQSNRSGRGLIGMRERIAMFGGELSAGRTQDGGYRVHASLPIGDAAR